jgi:hypothetical protein
MIRVLWAVMNPTPWHCLVTDGQPHDPPAPGCCGLLPLFETEQQARDWAGPDMTVTELHIPEP